MRKGMTPLVMRELIADGITSGDAEERLICNYLVTLVEGVPDNKVIGLVGDTMGKMERVLTNITLRWTKINGE